MTADTAVRLARFFGNTAEYWMNLQRDYDLHHVGVQLRAQLSPHQRLDISPYAQYRDIDHPIYEVIAQVSRDVGAEFRYENTAPLGGMNNRFTLGVQPAYEHMDNRQFVNEGGRHGAPTRDIRPQFGEAGADRDILGAADPQQLRGLAQLASVPSSRRRSSSSYNLRVARSVVGGTMPFRRIRMTIWPYSFML